jgi:hypothetical protein
MRPIGMVLNLLTIYNRANADEIRAGMRWYRDELSLVQRQVKQIVKSKSKNERDGLRTDRRTVAGVIAALSPQKSWHVNVHSVLAVYEHGKYSHTGVQNAKAMRIMAAEDPLDVLSGPKELAFFMCFYKHESTRRVVIDGHAYAAWMGEWINTTDARVTKRLSILAERDYQEAAEIMGLLPHQIQAIVWLAWRRIHNSKGHKQDNKS